MAPAHSGVRVGHCGSDRPKTCVAEAARTRCGSYAKCGDGAMTGKQHVNLEPVINFGAQE